MSGSPQLGENSLRFIVWLITNILDNGLMMVDWYKPCLHDISSSGQFLPDFINILTHLIFIVIQSQVVLNLSKIYYLHLVRSFQCQTVKCWYMDIVLLEYPAWNGLTFKAFGIADVVK